MRRRLIKPAVLAFLALSLICLPMVGSGALAQRHLHRRSGRPTRQGNFSGQPIVGGSLADGIRGRRSRPLIGAGAGAAGGTARSIKARRRHPGIAIDNSYPDGPVRVKARRGATRRNRH